MSPCSSNPSASKKLLISTPKPKSETESGHRGFPQNSESSRDAPTPQKRSRDLPNLSDCHGCGRRINYTNPKERLRPLDSVWRIVLLCLKCRKSCRLQQICSYCFEKNADCDDVFVCEICRRRIHKDCVTKYGRYAPWRYLGVESSRLSICVDCWVPQVIRKTLGFSWCSENKGFLKGNGEREVQKKAKEKDEQQQLRRVENVNGNSPRIVKSKCSMNGDSADGSKHRMSQMGKDGNLETNPNILENEHMDHGVHSVTCVGVKRFHSGLQTYVRDKNRNVWRLDIDPAAISQLSPPHSPCNSDDSRLCTQVLDPEASIDAPDPVNDRESSSPEILYTYKRSRFKRGSAS